MPLTILAERPIDQPAESPLVAHGRHNIETGQWFRDDRGVHTILSGSVEDERLNGGKPTVIPTVYGGKQLDWPEAIDRAVKSGIQWPSADTEDEATRISKEASAQMDQYITSAMEAPQRKFQVLSSRNVGEEPDKSLEWSDYGREVMAGFASMGAALGWLGQKIGEKTGDSFVERLGIRPTKILIF